MKNIVEDIAYGGGKRKKEPIIGTRRSKIRCTKLSRGTSKHPDNREGNWTKDKGQVKRKGLTLKRIIKELVSMSMEAMRHGGG